MFLNYLSFALNNKLCIELTDYLECVTYSNVCNIDFFYAQNESEYR